MAWIHASLVASFQLSIVVFGLAVDSDSVHHCLPGRQQVDCDVTEESDIRILPYTLFLSSQPANTMPSRQGQRNIGRCPAC